MLSKRIKDAVNILLGNQPTDDQWIPDGGTTMGHTVLGNLSPETLRTILKSSATGMPHDYLTLAEALEETDAHYRSVLGTRKQAVSGLVFKVEALSDDKTHMDIAEQVREILHAPEMPDLMEDLLDALAKGFSVVQITWDNKNGQWFPIAYDWRDPRLFKPDPNNPNILKINDHTPDGADMNPLDFIVFKPRLKSGLFIRSGLARLVAMTFLYKHLAIKDWNRFLAVYGMPVRMGKYGTNATAQDKATLRRAVRNIMGDGSAIIPESMQLEFMQSGGSHGQGATAYNDIADFLNKEISKAVLGQTMTSEDGSSHSQATVHNEVRNDIIVADARRLCACIVQQLIRPWLILNYGTTDAMPKITLPQEEIEDQTALANNLATLHNMGVPLSVSQIQDKFNLKAPDSDDDTLRLGEAQSQQNNTPQPQYQHQLNTQHEPDEDDLANEIYGTMTGTDNPWAVALNDFANMHDTLDGMHANMDKMADTLNNDAHETMVQTSAQGGFVAHLNGQLDVQGENDE